MCLREYLTNELKRWGEGGSVLFLSHLVVVGYCMSSFVYQLCVPHSAYCWARQSSGPGSLSSVCGEWE